MLLDQLVPVKALCKTVGLPGLGLAGDVGTVVDITHGGGYNTRWWI